MGEGGRLTVELVDGVSPLGQPVIIGVECAQVVDVPQQVGPTALLGAVVMVIGGVEVADQHASELIAQDLIHHGLAAAPTQEVALGGGAEGPHVAVVSVLAPAGLIGMDHRTASDAFQNARQFSLGLASHPLRGVHDGSQAEPQSTEKMSVAVC